MCFFFNDTATTEIYTLSLPDALPIWPKGTPSIGKINFRTLKEPNTQLAELLTGGVDWIWDVPKDQAERLAERGGVQVDVAEDGGVTIAGPDQATGAAGRGRGEALTGGVQGGRS